MKFICGNCKKDITDIMNDSLIASAGTEEVKEEQVALCPDCFSKGYAIAICHCGSEYIIEPIGKATIAESIEGAESEGKKYTPQDIINQIFIFNIATCPHCSEEVEEPRVLSMMPKSIVEQHIFKNTKLADVVMILDDRE